MEPTDSQLRLAVERLDAEAEWPEFVADRERSFVELAEAISRLEGKFEHLADVAVLFSPVRRFVLDRARSGDRAAAEVITDECRSARRLSLGEAHEFRDLLRKYRIEHEAELREYVRARYPWESLEQRIPPLHLPEVHELLDRIVLPVFGEGGFRCRSRSRKAGWRCELRHQGRLLEIVFEPDSYSTRLSGYLEIAALAYKKPLGNVFFFSGSSFPARERTEDLEAHISSFVTEYLRVFPSIWEAAGTSLTRAEAWWALGMSRRV